MEPHEIMEEAISEWSNGLQVYHQMAVNSSRDIGSVIDENTKKQKDEQIQQLMQEVQTKEVTKNSIQGRKERTHQKQLIDKHTARIKGKYYEGVFQIEQMLKSDSLDTQNQTSMLKKTLDLLESTNIEIGKQEKVL